MLHCAGRLEQEDEEEVEDEEDSDDRIEIIA